MNTPGVPRRFGGGACPVTVPVRRQSGFGYIEAILAIIIITVSFSGLVAAIGASLLTSSDPEFRYEALMVAQSYMDEVHSMAAIIDPAVANADPNANLAGACQAQGAAAGAQRTAFNEMCDYAGFVGRPTLKSGQLIDGLEYLQVEIRMLYNEAGAELRGEGNALSIGGNHPNPAVGRSTVAIEVDVSYDDRSGGRQSVLLRSYATR